MARMTLQVGDDTLRRVRLLSTQNRRELKVYLAAHLDEWLTKQLQGPALQRFLELTRDSSAGSGKRGRTWKREDLYDRGALARKRPSRRRRRPS